jgi:hypothetical protein
VVGLHGRVLPPIVRPVVLSPASEREREREREREKKKLPSTGQLPVGKVKSW